MGIVWFLAYTLLGLLAVVMVALHLQLIYEGYRHNLLLERAEQGDFDGMVAITRIPEEIPANVRRVLGLRLNDDLVAAETADDRDTDAGKERISTALYKLAYFYYWFDQYAQLFEILVRFHTYDQKGEILDFLHNIKEEDVLLIDGKPYRDQKDDDALHALLFGRLSLKSADTETPVA